MDTVERSRILDEFAAVTGYHRKHAIRLLAGRGKREEKPDANETPTLATLRRRTYGVEVRDALTQLWEVADRVCSKRLRPMVPVLLPALERHGRVVLDNAMRALLTCPVWDGVAQVRTAFLDAACLAARDSVAAPDASGTNRRSSPLTRSSRATACLQRRTDLASEDDPCRVHE